MSEKIFFDTNIIVYLYSDTETDKRDSIENLLEKNKTSVISTQVINEFAYVMHRKRKISYVDIAKAVMELSEAFIIANINLSTINYALTIANKYKYSYFDGLMIASALENNCNILYTEDLHDTHIIEKTLKIKNPFV